MSDTIKLSAPEKKGFWEIPILYEDPDLLALAKPALLLSSPDRYDAARPSLMELLHRDIERGAGWARQHNISYLMQAERLDCETSGVMLLAKSKSVLIALVNFFGSEKQIKTYVALVHGTPDAEQFEVDAKLGMHPTRSGFVRVDPKRGKRSRTRFTIREKFRGFTLLACQPLTTRMHQIRVHLQCARHSIVADQMYGGSPLALSSLKTNYRLKPKAVERPLLSRTALHAEELRLIHPVTQSELAISAPWPKDLAVAVKYLRQFAAV